MKNKLFILGWDNALVSDIVENKVHPAYLAMLAEVDPNWHARWTLDDTVSMQGEQPENDLLNNYHNAEYAQIFDAKNRSDEWYTP